MSYIPQTKGDRALVLGAMAVFIAALHYLWNYQPLSFGPGNAESLGVVVTDSPIRRRHAGTLSWHAIEEEGEIFFKDIVYTPAGTTAEVRLKNGKLVPLPADSLVQFDEVTVENIEIALRETAKKKNVFRLLPMPKAELSRLLPDPLTLEMLFDDLAVRMKQHLTQPRQVLVDVQIPKIEFKLESLSDYQIRLMQPKDKGVYNLRRDSWFTISWSDIPLPDVKYVLEIARNPEFRKKLPFTADTNRLQLQLQNPGTYYWRVRVIAKDQVLTSHARSFEMSLRGGSTDLLAKIKLPTVSLKDFITEIATDSDFSSLVETALNKEASCEPKTALASKLHYCRVKEAASGKVVKRYSFTPSPKRNVAGGER